MVRRSAALVRAARSLLALGAGRRCSRNRRRRLPRGRSPPPASAAPASAAASAAASAPADENAPPQRKPAAAPLPPPTQEQIDALAAMQAEAGEYEQSARDYRATLTLVVRHHYEEQRRRILEALDQEIEKRRAERQPRRSDSAAREFHGALLGARTRIRRRRRTRCFVWPRCTRSGRARMPTPT